MPTMVVSYRNSTSNHNIVTGRERGAAVVSYRNSTSNHNSAADKLTNTKLYLIEILHQTTTPPWISRPRSSLYLIEILHQTTTWLIILLQSTTLYLIEILHQTTTDFSV